MMASFVGPLAAMRPPVDVDCKLKRHILNRRLTGQEGNKKYLKQFIRSFF
jgi:hypothetical protein